MRLGVLMIVGDMWATGLREENLGKKERKMTWGMEVLLRGFWYISLK
jgi:hypothetical protein